MKFDKIVRCMFVTRISAKLRRKITRTRDQHASAHDIVDALILSPLESWGSRLFFGGVYLDDDEPLKILGKGMFKLLL